MKRISIIAVSTAFLLATFVFAAQPAQAATTYEVGPGKHYANINDVPWESLQAGDTVLIHWRSTPYKEKWVMPSGDGRRAHYGARRRGAGRRTAHH